jgi:hypothetical protein
MVDRPLLGGVAVAVAHFVLVAEIHAGSRVFVVTQGEFALGDIRQMHFDEDFGAGLDGVTIGAGLGRRFSTLMATTNDCP